MSEASCPACNSAALEWGHIQSTGLVYQRLDNARFNILEPAEIPVKSKMCMDCGHLMLFADAEKANRIISK
jgi:Zn ribbon nucleic-acid-binding protein